MEFGEKLIQLRALRGLTQSQLAASVGVSRQAVYKWETGQSYPEAKTLLALRNLFELTTVDELIDHNLKLEKITKQIKGVSPTEGTLAMQEHNKMVLEKVDCDDKQLSSNSKIVEVKEDPESKASREDESGRVSTEKEQEKSKTEKKEKKGFFSRFFQ